MFHTFMNNYTSSTGNYSQRKWRYTVHSAVKLYLSYLFRNSVSFFPPSTVSSSPITIWHFPSFFLFTVIIPFYETIQGVPSAFTNILFVENFALSGHMQLFVAFFTFGKAKVKIESTTKEHATWSIHANSR